MEVLRLELWQHVDGGTYSTRFGVSTLRLTPYQNNQQREYMVALVIWHNYHSWYTYPQGLVLHTLSWSAPTSTSMDKSIGHIYDYPTMHYFGNPRHSVYDGIYDFDWVFLEVPVKNCIVRMLLRCSIHRKNQYHDNLLKFYQVVSMNCLFHWKCSLYLVSLLSSTIILHSKSLTNKLNHRKYFTWLWIYWAF